MAVRCAEGVGKTYVLLVGFDAGLLAQFPHDRVPPVLCVVDEAAGQGEAAASGLDGAGDDDEEVPSRSVTGSRATATGSGLR